ncbi:MAG: EAL domain-containing protein, partial [Clostridia bacterium]|nr:EAL domain-containing protein [Clostridia bacterium]
AVLRHYGYEKDATLKILDDMCDDINRLSKGKSDEFVVSYNVNPDFYDREYCNKILEILDAHNVNHSNFAVELLEVSSLENVKAEDMLYMKEHGIKTYLDDFGTGFATKSVLKLPFSVVKIDGSLVENCDDDEKKQRVLAEIVKICASKGMKTLAEKVEEKSELDVLTNIGINKFQGYYYDAGLSADDFLKRDYMHSDENMSF